MRALTEDEVAEIAVSLEDYHGCFYVFFTLAACWFVGEDHPVPTAAVQFPKQRGLKPELFINEVFWRGLTHRERLFVICHETLHVLLDHGVRNGLSVPGATPRLVNIAQDITINEMIVDLFHYHRPDLRNWRSYCWIDTCFDDPSIIKRNETFLYYLEKLIKDPPKSQEEGGPSVLDSHGDLSGSSETQQQKEARESTAGQIAEELAAGELEQVVQALPEGISGVGTMTGNYELVIAKKLKRSKFRFSAIIKKLKRTSVKEVDRDLETFVTDDRRFADLARDVRVALPGKHEVQVRKPGKLLTAVFMDISGSCIEFFPVFQKVFAAFDRERRTFDTKLFVFDTRVIPIEPGRTARGAGGTNFGIIEGECLRLEAEVGRYPDCVIIITDGEGTEVAPRAPTRWVWLLTPYSTREFIHPKSRTFYIKDVLFS